MALTVETGTGLANADSYISVADADTYVANHTDASTWVDAKATGSLHLVSQPSNDDTVTVDAKTYKFQTALSDVDGNIKIGSTLAFSQANFRAAVNLDIDLAEDASSIADLMTIHPTVTTTGIASNVITLEAKTGGTAGNSIVTTETLTDELNHFEAATLLGGVSSKEQALRLATQYLDMVYQLRWKGERTNETQGLAWPRTGVQDFDSFTIPSDAIPQKLKDTTVEAALISIAEELLPDVTTPGTIKREKVKVGPIEQDITYLGGSSQFKTFSKVKTLIRDLIESGSIIRRG